MRADESFRREQKRPVCYHPPTMTSPAIEQAPPASYVIQGREVRLPVEVRDATAAVAFYLVSAAAAQRLIDASGLRIAQTLPGRALCTIGTMDYKDGDLGRYHEVAVSFFVRERGARAVPLAGTMLGLLRGTLGAYIHQLPVDGEFTCEAGQTIWGFPKFMAEISLTRDGDAETSVLTVDGEHVLTQSVRAGGYPERGRRARPERSRRGGRSFGERAQISYAWRDGVLYRTPSVMSGEGVAARLGGAALELGTHPIAGELRSLGLPKRALFSTYIGRMRAVFSAAERL